MRCPYCYNTDIVHQNGKLSECELFNFLRTRQGKLDGVVLSGGECTMYEHLPELCESIKSMGFNIKLDTNGTNPKMVKHLVEEMLVDYIALDFKAPKEKFKEITKNKNYNLFEETLDYLIHADISFEVRTTIHSDLLNETDVNKMIENLNSKNYHGTYYLQKYLHVDNTIGQMNEPISKFNTEKLSSKISLELRNF